MQQRQKSAQVEVLFSSPMSNGPSLIGRGAAVFAAALALTSVPQQAEAQERQSSPPLPVQGLYSNAAGATRYSTPDGGIRFIFDRSGGRVALVRFEGDPEVHVLRPAMAAGGGEIYRTDDGDVMLRVTPHGSLIVYTRTNRTGAAASEEARVSRLAPEAVAFAEMQQRFRAIQARARRSVGQTVSFTVPAQMSADAAGVVVDAAERAAEGLAAAPMTNVRRVIISIGSTPRVARRGDQLFIQVAPHLGYAGRPSSNSIRNVAMGEVQGPEQ
jgi:hypothetical protein